jgi:uncharacterized protein (DUF1330 family)
MAGYVIVDTHITDPDAAAQYRTLSGPSVERHGGHFIVRGGPFRVLEGSWQPARLVIIQFPSVDAAQEWYDSADYAEARAVRADAGEFRLVVVEGV